MRCLVIVLVCVISTGTYNRKECLAFFMCIMVSFISESKKYCTVSEYIKLIR